MINLKFLIFILLLQTTVLLSQPDGNKLVKTEMICEYSSVKPGMNFRLGIVITPAKNWHTYWINPGDAGLPTTVDFVLPKGVKAGEPIWETPIKIPFAGLANYGYESSNLLTIPIDISDDFQGESLKLKALVKWLVCKEECIPGSREIAFEIPVNSNPEVIQNSFDLFEDSKMKHSIINNDILVTNKMISEHEIELEIILPEYLKNISKLEFFPIESGFFDNGASQNFRIDGNNAYLNLKYDKYRENDPKAIHGILVSDVPLSENMPNKSVIIKSSIK